MHRGVSIANHIEIGLIMTLYRAVPEEDVVEVHAPGDIATLRTIHKAIEGMITHGPEFEAVLMSHPEVQQAEEWAWLFDPRSIGGRYYRWRLYEIKSGLVYRPEKRREYMEKGGIIRIFDGPQATHWKIPEPLPFEFTPHFAHFTAEPEYESDIDEDDEEERERQREKEYNPDRDQIEVTYIGPMAKAKLRWLLERLPTSVDKLMTHHVGPISALALEHSKKGMEEVAQILVDNVEHPFSLVLKNAKDQRKQALEEYLMERDGSSSEYSDEEMMVDSLYREGWSSDRASLPANEGTDYSTVLGLGFSSENPVPSVQQASNQPMPDDTPRLSTDRTVLGLGFSSEKPASTRVQASDQPILEDTPSPSADRPALGLGFSSEKPVPAIAGPNDEPIVEGETMVDDEPMSDDEPSPMSSGSPRASDDDMPLTEEEALKRKQEQAYAHVVALYIIDDILGNLDQGAGYTGAWRYRDVFLKEFQKRRTFTKLGDVDKELEMRLITANRWRLAVGDVLKHWESASAITGAKALFEEFEHRRAVEKKKRMEEEAEERARAKAASGEAQESVPAKKKRKGRVVMEGEGEDAIATIVYDEEEAEEKVQDEKIDEGYDTDTSEEDPLYNPWLDGMPLSKTSPEIMYYLNATGSRPEHANTVQLDGTNDEGSNMPGANMDLDADSDDTMSSGDEADLAHSSAQTEMDKILAIQAAIREGKILPTDVDENMNIIVNAPEDIDILAD
jgi:Surp module